MQCHALGKAFQWHRTKEDWTLLTNMHVAFFPQADSAFRRNAGAVDGGGGGGGGAAAGGRRQRISGCDTRFSGEELRSAHAGMVRLAGAHARAEDRRQVDGFGARVRAKANTLAR